MLEQGNRRGGIVGRSGARGAGDEQRHQNAQGQRWGHGALLKAGARIIALPPSPEDGIGRQPEAASGGPCYPRFERSFDRAPWPIPRISSPPSNAEQRLAVEHGTASSEQDSGPLLVIAGAGSGKTNTLAYRVAHLVRSGADPQRILLLTFSRRAAAEMERRAGQLLHRAFGTSTRQAPSALQWAGTFHSVGARLLREYAPRIGLQESFTILDRGDAEDLIAIVRHELGLDTTKRRFPTKATCLSIYSRVVNSEAALAVVLRSRRIPGAPRGSPS